MKKLNLFATAAIVAMTGCTQSESFDGLLTQDLEISFDAFSGNATKTKVGFATGKITDASFKFASVAFYTEESDAWINENGKTTGTPWDGIDSLGTQWLRFTDIKAVKDNNNNKIVSFKSDTKAYWPKKGYLNFFSWYPSDVKNVSMSKGALKIADYKVVAAANQDLMVADPALGLFRTDDDANYTPTDADYSGVKTMFRHKLTKIGVEAKVKDLGEESNLEKFEVTIKKVEIESVAYKGTFQGVAVATDSNNKGEWTVDTTSAKRTNYNFPINETPVKVVYPYTNDDPYYVSAVDDQIMLLPQTRIEMGPNAVLKLTCDLEYTVKGATKPIVEKDYVYQTTISDLQWNETEQKWEEKPQQQGGPKYLDWGINQYIIYRLVLGLDEIEWAPVVMDWETEYVEPIDVQ